VEAVDVVAALDHLQAHAEFVVGPVDQTVVETTSASTGRLWPVRETISASSLGPRHPSPSHREIGPARLVGRRPHDGFGLLEIATRGGLGEAARLPSILPPP
jgi:hypothetical protein